MDNPNPSDIARFYTSNQGVSTSDMAAFYAGQAAPQEAPQALAALGSKQVPTPQSAALPPHLASVEETIALLNKKVKAYEGALVEVFSVVFRLRQELDELVSKG